MEAKLIKTDCSGPLLRCKLLQLSELRWVPPEASSPSTDVQRNTLRQSTAWLRLFYLLLAVFGPLPATEQHISLLNALIVLRFHYTSFRTEPILLVSPAVFTSMFFLTLILKYR